MVGPHHESIPCPTRIAKFLYAIFKVYDVLKGTFLVLLDGLHALNSPRGCSPAASVVALAALWGWQAHGQLHPSPTSMKALKMS